MLLKLEHLSRCPANIVPVFAPLPGASGDGQAASEDKDEDEDSSDDFAQSIYVWLDIVAVNQVGADRHS